jgi:hypothetical protein
MAKMWWKRKKTFAMLANKRQVERGFDPTNTLETEITTESGVYISTEALFDANNNSLNYYIIAE